MKWITRGMLLWCLVLTACAASKPNFGDEFERSVKAYNRLLRWREIESAGVTYIDPERQDQFQKQAESLKKRGITITDYRIISTRYLPEKQTGNALTEFDYYILPSSRIKTITYPQEWFYRENTKSWKLTSGLELFE